MKKNDILQLKIESTGINGEGIGKVDGYTLFIKDAVEGDFAEVKIIKANKNFGYARLMKIINPSPYRVEAPCPVARQCGGCQLQEVAYDRQLEFKRSKVADNLKKIGHFDNIEVLPVIGMDEPFRYRNKAQFPVGKDKEGNIIMGFYAGRTHSIIENDDCLLGITENKTILNTIKSYMQENNIEPYDEETGKGVVRHILIRKGFKTGEIMVCIVINAKKLPYADKLVATLKNISGMTSISYNINTKNTNVILGTELVNLYGDGYITDYIKDTRFQISPLSFYQVNPVQTEVLYGKALEYACLTGNETVWDLYCGIGTISLFLARNAKKVYGVEVVPEAIADARRNAKINGIENAEFFVGKSEEILPDFYKKNGGYADVIVVDPPRKGCDATLLDTIVKMSPKKVVYVSCDSATLARDLKYMDENGYEVVKVQPVDMFPASAHVECVVMLSHKKPDSVINVKVEFGDGKDQVSLDNIAERVEQYKPKEKVTYSMIQNYIEEKYEFKVHTAYIAEVKRGLGLPMYDALNAVEELKQPRKHPTPEKVEAIKDALRYFKII